MDSDFTEIHRYKTKQKLKKKFLVTLFIGSVEARGLRYDNSVTSSWPKMNCSV